MSEIIETASSHKPQSRTQVRRTKLKNGMVAYYRDKPNDLWALQNVASGDEYTNYVNKTDNGIWLDVGANIGAFAMLVADHCEKVICIEPHPENCELLIKNLKENGITNYELIPAAVCASKRKEKKLYLVKNNYMSFSTVRKDKNYITVPAIHPKDLPDFNHLKVDCEGAEYELLKHYRIHKQSVSKVICEWHHNILSERDYNVTKATLNLKYPYVYAVEIPESKFTSMLYAHR